MVRRHSGQAYARAATDIGRMHKAGLISNRQYYIRLATLSLPVIVILLILAWSWMSNNISADSSEILVKGAISLAVIVLAVFGIARLIRFFRQRAYFASEEFISKRDALASVIAEYNDLNNYIDSLESASSLDLESASSAHTDLANFTNTSTWNYRRDRYQPDYSTHVHNCSLQVVRSASQNPIKYLIKYFIHSADQQTLERVEELGNQLANVEEGRQNLDERLHSIVHTISPPKFILKHYRVKFLTLLNFQEVETRPIQYPTYRFQYVSAGGNSSQVTTISLNPQTLDTLAETLAQKIKFAKSIAGQRALMTSQLRKSIKVRDNYTCQMCGISIHQEPHLLLEVDHIIPVSRGGMTAVDNLQTLCWKCNRSKSNKLLA